MSRHEGNEATKVVTVADLPKIPDRPAPGAPRRDAQLASAWGEIERLEHQVDDLTAALASAELRGAQRQREADVKALRDRVQWAKWCADRYVADGGQLIDIRQPTDGADFLSGLPLAASPEEKQP